MPGCCVKGCQNRSELGFSMKRFPINKERKLLWLKYCGRPDWTPTNNAVICEVCLYYLPKKKH